MPLSEVLAAMPLKISVTDTQVAKDQIRKALEKLMTDKFVTVGMHEDAGQHPDSEMTNAQLGAILHFGAEIQHPAGHTIKIPPRPFLDVGVASGNQEYIALIADGLEDGLTPDQILEEIGNAAVGKVQVYMTDLKEPGNAESTKARKKGAANPLIDEGHLRRSVTYKIQSGKPEEGIG